MEEKELQYLRDNLDILKKVVKMINAEQFTAINKTELKMQLLLAESKISLLRRGLEL